MQASHERVANVCASLGSVSATKCEMRLTGESKEPLAAPLPNKEFTVVQILHLNDPLKQLICHQCVQAGLIVQQTTKIGLAVRLALFCLRSGTIAN